MEKTKKETVSRAAVRKEKFKKNTLSIEDLINGNDMIQAAGGKRGSAIAEEKIARKRPAPARKKAEALPEAEEANA